MRSRTLDPRSIAAYTLLIISVVVFAVQLHTLDTVPVYDSVRWGGDETWLMREFVNQIQHGTLQYPESFGGAIRTNGVLAGSMWGNALIYGVPGIVFYPHFDFASIGRSVTALLSLLLIGSLYFISRSLRVSPLVCALGVMFMVLSQGFVWASHSARYDILTGLVLLWYCYYLSKVNIANALQMRLAGALGIFIVCFSPHLLTLGAGGTIVFLFAHSIWKRPAALFSWLAGFMIAVAILVVLYFVGSGEFSLFGRGGKAGIFSFVLNEVPILRPFSRNVQLSNLQERIVLFKADLPGMLVVLPIAALLMLTYIIRNRKHGKQEKNVQVTHSPNQRFWLGCTVLCTLSWLLLEGSRPYYLFHIVPLLVIGSMIAFDIWGKLFSKRSFGQWTPVVSMVFGISLGISHAIPNATLGNAIAHDQQLAITRLLNEAAVSAPRKSRILVDVAGLDRALVDTSREVLTLDMFQPPADRTQLVDKLYANSIDYVILRSSTVGTPFEPGRALLPHVIDSIGVVRDSALGLFYDDGRSYNADLSILMKQGLDTLRLYYIHSK